MHWMWCMVIVGIALTTFYSNWIGTARMWDRDREREGETKRDWMHTENLIFMLTCFHESRGRSTKANNEKCDCIALSTLFGIDSNNTIFAAVLLLCSACRLDDGNKKRDLHRKKGAANSKKRNEKWTNKYGMKKNDDLPWCRYGNAEKTVT